MRFTIQTLSAAPRLKGFVLDILSNLVNKQVIASPPLTLLFLQHALLVVCAASYCVHQGLFALFPQIKLVYIGVNAAN